MSAYSKVELEIEILEFKGQTNPHFAHLNRNLPRQQKYQHFLGVGQATQVKQIFPIGSFLQVFE